MPLKSNRDKFSEARPPLPDSEFVARLSAPPELLRFLNAAREALGRVCQIPASSIYPEDQPQALEKLVMVWDDLNVILELETLLGASLASAQDGFPGFLTTRFFWHGRPGPHTIGQWAVQVAEHLHSRFHAQEPG
jgi:hypothetical protein